MIRNISPKKSKEIYYNYSKLSPDRASARDDEEKVSIGTRQEKVLRIDTKLNTSKYYLR